MTCQMKKALFSILFALITISANSQVLDIARIEYTYIPSDESGYTFQRKRFLFNYPMKLQKDAFLFVGLDYSSIDLEIREEVSSFDQKKTEDFRLLDLNLSYTSKINDDWRFGARLVPGFSSNLEGRSLLFDDAVMSGAIVFIKDKKGALDVPKPFRIILGLAYSGNGGIPFPIPFISYYKKFHPKWSYNVGVPTTNFQFHLSERVRLKLFSQLDGFNSNLQEGLSVNGTQEADQIRMSHILCGLRYEYKIADHLEFYFNTTRSVYTRLELRNGREDLTLINRNNLIHLKTGLRVKI